MKTKLMNNDRLRLVRTEQQTAQRGFAEDVARGLTLEPKQLDCRYLYDETGSQIFEAICDLPEYYLTRAESEILRQHADEIAGLFPQGVVLVELGSGSSVKTRLLIEAFLAAQPRLSYVSIDISREILESSARALLKDHSRLEVTGIAAEYQAGLRHLPPVNAQPRLVLFLGSNLGNFDRPGAVRFLRRIRETLSERDCVLVGIDLRKDRETLERAYDDEQGVTARFNLNLLQRINRELGGHFDAASFRHRAEYNSSKGRVGLRLISRKRQAVPIDALALEVPFASGEVIETENSYKYNIPEIQQLAAAAGLQTQRRWLDRNEAFSLNLFAPAAMPPGITIMKSINSNNNQ